MNQFIKKITALVVTISLMVSVPAPVLAKESSTPKEEVIYMNLDGAGAVEHAYVVNVFEMKEDGTILDYGNYTETRNMTTNDVINVNEDKITIDTPQGKLYYQGTLEEVKMPWNISITYYLDGKEYKADDLAGKSGSLQIKLAIKQNETGNQHFFHNYALQASLTLDTEKCKEIIAKDATMANVGNEKQITYTILPDEEKEYTIQSQVTNFEMDGIQINGVCLNLNIDLSETDELTEKVIQLQDGIIELDEGADDLNKGVDSLASGTEQLKTGAETLKNGLSQLSAQSPKLKSGSKEIKNALNKIDNELEKMSVSTEALDKLTNGSKSAKSGIKELVNGLNSLQNGFETYENGLKGKGIDKKALQESNKSTISFLKKQIKQLNSQFAAIKSQNPSADTSALEAQITSLTQMQMLLTANSGLIDADSSFIQQLEAGVTSAYNGSVTLQKQYEKLDTAIQQLPKTINTLAGNLTGLQSAIHTLTENYKEYDTGIGNYTSAFQKIVDGYETLYSGVKDASDGVGELNSATSKLKDGTYELKDKTKNTDKEVTDKIDKIKSKVQKNDFTPISFVSDKNTEVKSVQFVIKTKAIELPEEIKDTEEEKEELGFWQKLLNLF